MVKPVNVLGVLILLSLFSMGGCLGPIYGLYDVTKEEPEVLNFAPVVVVDILGRLQIVSLLYSH